MIEKQNGDHYRMNKYWDNKLHAPYDYVERGLNKRIMSHKLWNTNNQFLRNILSFVETSIDYVMETADILFNFYNYNWKNR